MAKALMIPGTASDVGKRWGSYLHGIFGNARFRERWLRRLFKAKGLRREPADRNHRDPYDLWAAHLWRHLDMDRIFDLVELKRPRTLRFTGSHRSSSSQP